MRGWPGNETVSQGSGGEHPRGKPCGSYSRPLQHLEKLRSEGKALKRDRVRREWSAIAEQQEGRGRETGTHPFGGMLREGNLVSAVGNVIFRQGRVGRKPPGGTNPGGGWNREARPGEDRSGLMRCGDTKPRESHRGQTQPARRPAAQTRKAKPRPGELRKRRSERRVRQGRVGRPFESLERGGEGGRYT